MAQLQITRGTAAKKDHRPVLIHIITDEGQALLFEADPGDFSRGIALHKPFSVSAIEPDVERPRAI